MNNLFVTIEGLALYRLVNKQWKIFFPKAADHPFKLIVKKRDGADILGVNEFVFANGTAEIVFLTGNNEDGSADTTLSKLDSVNIAKLHKKYFGKDEEIVLLDHNDSNYRVNYAGILDLNGAKLGAETSNPVSLAIWTVEKKEIDGVMTIVKTRKTTEGVSVGGFLKARYEIEKEVNLKITSNSSDFDLKLPFDKENIIYDITFSNDCEILQFGNDESSKYLVGNGCMDISDFSHYYQLIDNSKLKGTIEFTVKSKNEKRTNGPCSPTGG